MSHETRKPCCVTRPYFTAEAKPVDVLIVAQLTPEQLTAVKALLGSAVLHHTSMDPRTFSTNSMGWNANGKLEVPISPSTTVKCQLGLNLTIANSKELPLV